MNVISGLRMGFFLLTGLVIALAWILTGLASVSSLEDIRQAIFNSKRAEMEHCCSRDKTCNISVFSKTDRTCFRKS